MFLNYVLFLNILLLSSVVADFDSEYLRTLQEENCVKIAKIPNRLRLFIFPFLFLFHLPLSAGPSEIFAILNSNEVLTCQANEQAVWWTQDERNITTADKG